MTDGVFTFRPQFKEFLPSYQFIKNVYIGDGTEGTAGVLYAVFDDDYVQEVGPVSDYYYAIQNGYTGTPQEWVALICSLPSAAQETVDAKEAAVEAQAKAEEAQGKTEDAQNKAEQAQADAEAAQALSEAARDASQQAQGLAEIAKNDTQIALTEARKAQHAAESAQSLSETAKEEAQAAQAAAENAKTGALEAQLAANDAQKRAELAADKGPHISSSTQTWIVWDSNTSQWVDTGIDARGLPGAQGIQGEPGKGIIAGGTTGQALVKNSATDYDTIWRNVAYSINGSTPNENGEVLVDIGITGVGYANGNITKTNGTSATNVVSADTLKTDMGLGKVENKSSADIRGELTSSDVEDALGFTPADISDVISDNEIDALFEE